MPTLEQLTAAQEKALAAGDTAAAERYAVRIKAAQPTTSTPVAPAGPPTPEGIATGPPTAREQRARDIETTARANPVDQLTRGFASALGDKALGVRQFIAGVTGEDPEELRKKVAEREAAQKKEPFLARTGNVAGTIVPEMLVGSGAAQWAGKAAGKFLPKALTEFVASKGVTPALTRTVLGAGGGAAGGAADAPFNPTTGNETPFERMVSGAKWGAAGNLGGRMLGGLWAPFSNAKPSAASLENVERLKQSGIPMVTPATEFGPGIIQNATNALEQIMGLGHVATKNRNDVLEWLTRDVTRAAGHEVPILTNKAREQMKNRLEQQGNAFRTGPDVDVTGVESAAKKAADEVKAYAEATSQKSAVKRLEAAGAANAPPPPPPATPSPILGPNGKPLATAAAPAAAATVTKTADEIMNLRRAASKLAHETDDPVVAAQYRNLRDAYDDSLKKTLTKPEDFDIWRKQWGNMEDASKIAKRGTEGGRFLPHVVADVKVPGFTAQTAQERMYRALAEQMPARPGGWNRALTTSLLLGVPIGAGALGGVTEGSPGAATGLTVGAALTSALSRKTPSKAKQDAMRRFLTAAGITERE